MKLSARSSAYLIGVIVVSLVYTFGWWMRGSGNLEDYKLQELRHMRLSLAQIAEHLPPQKIVKEAGRIKICVKYDCYFTDEVIFYKGCANWKGGTWIKSGSENEQSAPWDHGACEHYTIAFER